MRTSIRSLVLFGLLIAGLAQAEQEAIRFATVDVYLQSDAPVAAWQFECSDRRGLMQVVGVERGESPAYQRAPYYDREAVRLGKAERIIVADYSLASATELPSGRTRIATLHLMLSGEDAPDLNAMLIIASDSAGQAIEASIDLVLRSQ